METNLLKLKPNTSEVKRIIKAFDVILEQQKAIIIQRDAVVKNVAKTTSNYTEDEILKTLESIDIEEINRGSISIRVSSLKKAGYSNYLQIYKLKDFSQLYKLDGISQTTAYQIKNIVYETANEIKKHTLPQISIDDKNNKATELVKSIYIYQNSKNILDAIENLYSKHKAEILSHITNAKRITSSIMWLFTAKSLKEEAITSYLELKELEEEKYLENVEFYISKLKELELISTNIVWKDFENNSAKYYTTLENLLGIKGMQTSKYGLSSELAESINKLDLNLKGLKCILRNYQEFGVKYILHQKQVLLGDEMGLGKTVQAIGAMVCSRNLGEKYFLVVCPASVLINWFREIKLHSDLTPIKIHGEDRDSSIESWLKSGGVAITTYETLSKINLDNLININMLIVDEAHYIKNPKAQRTKNLLKAREKSDKVLFMTGTPLENNVDEMHFLINCLQPEIAKSIVNFKHLSSAKMFKEKVSPVYFRRTRNDVLKELPDLIENEEWCEMSEEEKQLYKDNTNAENFMAMRQVSWEVENILNSSKGQRLLELHQKAIEEKRKIIVFSFFLKTLEKVQTLLGNNCIGLITGAVSPDKRQEIVDKFAKSPDGSVLVAQIQAGGTGLNIQTASMVVLCEPQLKPSTENQAISRTYRMGQVRNVLVYRLLCDESVDERIMEILENKQNIFDNFADKSVMGKHSIEITENATKKIIEKEKERLAISK